MEDLVTFWKQYNRYARSYKYRIVKSLLLNNLKSDIKAVKQFNKMYTYLEWPTFYLPIHFNLPKSKHYVMTNFSLKDLKESFTNNSKVRLINPTKSKVGRISMIIIDVNESIIINHFNLKQQKNT